MKHKIAAFSIMTVLLLCSHTTIAAVGAGMRLGSLGYGLDMDFKLTDTLTARLGYNGFSYDETLTDTDVTYNGTIKINTFSALMDWHVFHGGFRFSVGAVNQGPKVDVTGVPTNNAYVINNTTYTLSDIGSLSGTIKIGDNVAPYIGIGWGNLVDMNHRITFLFDLGVVHTGSPTATLDVRCGSSITTQMCTQITDDVMAEKARLEDEASSYKWYPILNLGIGVRF